MVVTSITVSDMFTDEVNKILNKLLGYSLREDIQRYRSPFVFRGLSNFDYELTPQIARYNNYYLDKKLEYHLLRSFRRYSLIDSNRARVSLWRQIAIAQHHHLPTRLLDWTFSPFVALHFATCDLNDKKMNEDGVVWCVDPKLVHRFIPEQLKNELNNVGCDLFSTRMLDHALKDPNRDYLVREQLEQFESLKPEGDGEYFAIFFEPPSLDDRITNQYALFSAMSKPRIPLDVWLRRISSKKEVEDGIEQGSIEPSIKDNKDINKNIYNKEIIYKKVRIPCSVKWEIRNRLDQANINERILFPGLDGLAEWLKRHYGPPPQQG